MNPQTKFHLVFSMVMGATMVFLMTFIITLINVGWVENFSEVWAKAFFIAFVIVVPVKFFLAPMARKATGRLLGMPA